MTDKNDASDVGQGKTHPDFTDKYDSKAGKYKDAAIGPATEDKLATAQMPKAPDPSPFVLGPMAPGGRS